MVDGDGDRAQEIGQTIAKFLRFDPARTALSGSGDLDDLKDGAAEDSTLDGGVFECTVRPAVDGEGRTLAVGKDVVLETLFGVGNRLFDLVQASGDGAGAFQAAQGFFGGDARATAPARSSRMTAMRSPKL